MTKGASPSLVRDAGETVRDYRGMMVDRRIS